MAFPAWGVAIIVCYSLLQIPAVLLIARYCEVEASDLPTPPARSYWRARRRTGETDGVLCDRCGTENGSAYGRCRHCVAPL